MATLLEQLNQPGLSAEEYRQIKNKQRKIIEKAVALKAAHPPKRLRSQLAELEENAATAKAREK